LGTGRSVRVDDQQTLSREWCFSDQCGTSTRVPIAWPQVTNRASRRCNRPLLRNALQLAGFSSTVYVVANCRGCTTWGKLRSIVPVGDARARGGTVGLSICWRRALMRWSFPPSPRMGCTARSRPELSSPCAPGRPFCRPRLPRRRAADHTKVCLIAPDDLREEFVMRWLISLC
jgi:hypothetical protein